MAEFSFQNDSDKDLVFFLERGEPLAIMSSYYVRAHSKLEFAAVPSGNYVVRIYDGKKWRDAIGRLDGNSLGGFTEDVEFVGDIVLTSDPSRHSAPELKVAIIGVPHYPTELTYDQYELSVKRQ